MSDFETEFSNSFLFTEEKSAHFSQTGPLNEPALSQLRDQIKKVMIPLLIKTFQLKLELNQSLSLPSRLQNLKNRRSPDEVIEQLRTLDNDLKMLLLWCQSCQSQIQKALSIPDEEQKNKVTIPSSSANPAVAKSFSEAITAQSSFFQQQPAAEKAKKNSLDSSPISHRKNWWKKLLMGKH